MEPSDVPPAVSRLYRPRNDVPVLSPEQVRQQIAEIDAREQREQAQARAQALYNVAGIPARFRQASFGNFVADTPQKHQVLTMAVEFADAFGGGGGIVPSYSLLFSGSPGTGKTHLSAAVIRDLARRGIRSRYETFQSIITAVHASYAPGALPGFHGLIERLGNVPLLVIDEVGITTSTKAEARAAEAAIMFSVINRRYEEQRPTLLAFNLTLEELPSAIGERVVDRLREGRGRAAVFNWASERSTR